MKYYYLTILFVLFACSNKEFYTSREISHPSHIYNIVNIDTSLLSYFETDYIPVYSEIYHMDGTRRMLLTTTLSIRNTSLSDSALITKADYYDSYGKKLRSYIDSTILIKPLESLEFVVEYKEEEGGVGANFIVEWGAFNYSNQILIQSVMIGTSGQQGISFSSEAKIIKKVDKSDK